MQYRGALAQARHRYAQARDNYILVFFLILFVIALTIALPGTGVGGLVITVVQTLALLLTLHNAGVTGRALNVARLATLVPILGALAGVVFHREVGWLYFVVMTVLIVCTQAAIIMHAVDRRTITADTIMGALCVYLLLGLLFATLDSFYAAVVAPFFVQQGEHPTADYVYFSFVTLETVGYGDLTPVPSLPRILAIAEGLFGQLYLVTVISLLVGNLGAERLRKRPPEGSEE